MFLYLALGHCAQGLNNGQLDLQTRCLVNERHHLLHHLRCGLLELGMFLGEEQHLIVQKIPVARVLADSDNRNQKSRSSRQIGCLDARGSLVKSMDDDGVLSYLSRLFFQT